MIRTAAILGFTAVAIGAFGAHGLKQHVTPYQLDIFEKGVQYQFYHSLAILAAGILLTIYRDAIWIKRAARAFVLGIFCFSGSLYLLACKDMIPVPVALLGPITPIGGVFFMIGWGLLLVGTRDIGKLSENARQGTV